MFNVWGSMIYPPNSFVGVAQTIIKHAEIRVKAGENSPTLVRDYKQRLTCYCQPYFKKTLVRDVDHRMLKAFYADLVTKGLSSGSIRPILSFVSCVLKSAADEGLIRTVPNIPRPKHKDSPRPSFTRVEYRTLLQTLKEQEKAKQKLNFKGHELDRELRDAVTMMVACFLRPGDLFDMKNRHVEVVDETGVDARKFLRMKLPPSKGHHHPTVSMKHAVDIYARVVAHQRKKGFGRPDDYVFLPGIGSRAYAQEVFSRLFVQVLELAGLRRTADGAARSFYSLRHYAIESRLVHADGLDLLTLARNCRTSPEMINRFYAHWLEPERNLDIIQSFRRESRYS